jgi:hypothetical protein
MWHLSYRVERTSLPGGTCPAEVQRLSRRTFSSTHAVPSQALISTTESGQQDEKDQHETDSCRYSDDPLLPA